MDLENDSWSAVDGAYKIPYDASIALKQLDGVEEKKFTDTIFSDLWENLHHQGDVGIASYMSVPVLIQICINKNSLNWNFIGLVLVIENNRKSESNPELPSDIKASYYNALSRFEEYLLLNFQSFEDSTAFRLALALLATLRGHFDLGKGIEILDDDALEELLGRY